MRRVKIFAGRCAVCCQIITEGHVTFGDKSIHTKCMKVSMEQASYSGKNIYLILKHHSFILHSRSYDAKCCLIITIRFAPLKVSSIAEKYIPCPENIVLSVPSVRGAGGGQVPHLQGPPHLREALPPSGPRVLRVRRGNVCQVPRAPCDA